MLTRIEIEPVFEIIAVHDIATIFIIVVVQQKRAHLINQPLGCSYRLLVNK